MDLGQRYIEVDMGYDFDDWFIEELKSIPINYSLKIVQQLETNLNNLPVQEGWTQKVAGVIRSKEPFYFTIEYIHQPGEYPVFLSMDSIEVDEFLDYMNLNQTLEKWNRNQYTT